MRWIPLLTFLLTLATGCIGSGSIGSADADGDGIPDVLDCQPGDSEIFPGAREVLFDGIDQNCDGVDGHDNDGDGFAVDVIPKDCDDADVSVYPGAPDEVGDGIDNDCDGTDAPQGGSSILALREGPIEVPDWDLGDDDDSAAGDDDDSAAGDDDDDDGAVGDDDDSAADDDDAAGDDDDSASGDDDDSAGDDDDSAEEPEGDDDDSADSGDDDDSTPTGDDDDSTPEPVDFDGDGFPETTDCNDADPLTYPGASEQCDGLDNDCDGLGETDSDNDGWLPCEGDCDDSNVAVAPDEPEACDNIDNDCNGSVDDGLPLNSYWTDLDGDNFGGPAGLVLTCGAAPAGTAGMPGDCDDSDSAVNPGMIEICNGVDDNCSGTVDAGLDFDADGDGFNSFGSCANPSDCDDADAMINPGAEEVCDGADNDCDPATDPENTDADADGWTICDGDCGDDEPLANPDFTQWASETFVDNEGNDSWDWNCNGAEDYTITLTPQGTNGQNTTFCDWDSNPATAPVNDNGHCACGTEVTNQMWGYQQVVQVCR